MLFYAMLSGVSLGANVPVNTTQSAHSLMVAADAAAAPEVTDGGVDMFTQMANAEQKHNTLAASLTKIITDTFAAQSTAAYTAVSSLEEVYTTLETTIGPYQAAVPLERLETASTPPANPKMAHLNLVTLKQNVAGEAPGTTNVPAGGDMTTRLGKLESGIEALETGWEGFEHHDTGTYHTFIVEVTAKMDALKARWATLHSMLAPPDPAPEWSGGPGVLDPATTVHEHATVEGFGPRLKAANDCMDRVLEEIKSFQEGCMAQHKAQFDEWALDLQTKHGALQTKVTGMAVSAAGGPYKP